MLKNIIFIGGIHGVGKSTVCTEICKEGIITSLSASDLIKWSEMNDDPKNKNVANVQDTQDKLIAGLNNIKDVDHNYLLDGHFCLLGRNDEISQVPLSLFQSISPKFLCLITGDVDEINRNMVKRDGKSYNIELLAKMQDEEIKHATFISDILGVPLIVGTKEDFSDIQNAIYDSLN